MGARGLDQENVEAEVQWGLVKQEKSSFLTVFYQNVSVCVCVCDYERINDPRYQRKLQTLRIVGHSNL